MTHHEPVSPDTPGLLLEEQEKKARWSKQLNFNKAFDVTKVLAEVMSLQSKDVFVKHLQTSKSYLAMHRTGLPEELLEYLDNC